MVCSTKPGKGQSIKAKDKRRLSLLNADFKVLTGLEVGRFRKVLTHTLSPHQLALGDDRRISFGIFNARDAIYAATMRKQGCDLADNDFEAAFDFLCLDWVHEPVQGGHHHPHDQQLPGQQGVQQETQFETRRQAKWYLVLLWN